MAVVWKLQGGTVAVATALGDLGLSSLVRTRRSLALDELTFEADGADLDTIALFAYGDTVTLTKTIGAGAPVKWFVGICVEVPRLGRGGLESVRYRIAGAWWYFENLTFQQNWPTVSTSGSRRAMVVAGYSPPAGTRQDTKAFVQDVLDWLIGSGTGAVIQYSAGALPAGFQVPFTRLDCPTCAEALQHICRWMPDAASRFDYTTTPPTLVILRRSAAGGLTYPLTSLAQLEITPRNELVMNRLVIQYVTVGSGGSVALAQEVDPGGTTGREFGCAVFTLNNDVLPLPAGLAANYRAGLSTLQYSGKLVVEEEECSQAISPGDVVNVSGALAEWATMYAQVQQVIEEMDRGRTTLMLGPPTHLRLDDFIEVLRMARNQTDEAGFAGVIKTGTYARTQRLKKDFSPAGNYPTASEISDAIRDAFSGKPAPRVDDRVDLTIDNELRFCAHVHDYTAIASAGEFVVGFIVSGVQHYAHVRRIPSNRILTQVLSYSGPVPTDTEIETAFAAAYTAAAAARPWDGDVILLTVGGARKFKAIVDHRFATNWGVFIIHFAYGGITYYTTVDQVGIF